MNIKVGDTLVYPPHGAVTVTDLRTRPFKDCQTKFVQFRAHHDGLLIELPLGNAETVGVRKAISKKGVKEVFAILKAKVPEDQENWSRRFKANQEKINSGDIYKVSEVVRDLSLRALGRGSSAGEKHQLEQAMRILCSELALAEKTDNDTARAMIEAVYGPVDATA
jgi:CarD family transcriptional regulator